MTDSPWMTFAEACAYSKIGEKSLYRALRVGDLPAVQGLSKPNTQGGRWRIHRDDLDSWLRGNVGSPVVSSIRPHGRGAA